MVAGKLAWTASTQGEGRRSKMKRKEEGGFSGERQEEGVDFIDKEGGRACMVREK